jgi:broad specificity phosphatase PhoE
MGEPRNIMLVRHGESETNQTDQHQSGDQFEIDPLDEIGNDQALALAERFADVPLEAILCTSYLRGLQTAMPVHNVTGAPLYVPVITDEGIKDLPADDPSLGSQKSLLRELDLPSELAGMRFKEPAALAIKDEIHRHLYDPDWHYSDEENLNDAWDRAGKILEYIKGRPEKVFAVVSHGGILKICLSRILLEDMPESTPRSTLLHVYQSFTRPTWWDNTGVVSMKYGEEEGWRWLMADNRHIGPEYFAFMRTLDQKAAEHVDSAPEAVHE